MVDYFHLTRTTSSLQAHRQPRGDRIFGVSHGGMPMACIVSRGSRERVGIDMLEFGNRVLLFVTIC